ncbi:Endonuclease III [Candidatus Bealeia paramacronuclearis]|uniref:Endonuclease III n=1 Tax=Candidatus Bealeia paramacronuclearis TaxID=1921001 RepID=A0ABZ2C1B6_9PROT
MTLAAKRLLTPVEIEEFLKALQNENPHPQGELYWTNTYTLLVAVTLSAQATDKGVNKATAPLFEAADTPQKMLYLGEDGLKSYIKTIGLFPSKAKNIMAAAEILVEKYNGQVPRTREELVTLPGVGRKTANVVLNVAFGEPTIAVDTHLFRISNRTGLAFGKNPEVVEKELIKRIPQTYIHDAHHWLILLGRYVCKARKPECYRCVVNDICQYPEKTTA